MENMGAIVICCLGFVQSGGSTVQELPQRASEAREARHMGPHR